jgi:AraC family transcriptional regulator
LRLIRRAQGKTCTFAADDNDLVELYAALTSRQARGTRGEPPAWLAQTMGELRADWNSSTTVGSIARRAGVHPVYLARCVRRWYNVGVAEELRRVRMQRAAVAVADISTTVSGIAHEYGFSDEPHLCRQFEHDLGLTPGRYRKLVRSLDYTWRGRT